MIQHLTKKRDEEGFTLIELLVVIVILGILAAVVVFAVGGITDKGQTSACAADKKSIQTAEEAYFAQPVSAGGGNGSYATMTKAAPGPLVPKFLAEASSLHTATAVAKTADTPASYSITGVGACAAAS